MMKVKSRVKLNFPKIRKLTQAQVSALEETAGALHTEIAQAQVVPRDTGNLQGESFFVDNSEAQAGKVTLVHSTPYARRLYFHPEYHFSKDENPNAKGKWLADWADPPDGNGNESEWIRKTYEKLYRRLSGL